MRVKDEAVSAKYHSTVMIEADITAQTSGIIETVNIKGERAGPALVLCCIR